MTLKTKSILLLIACGGILVTLFHLSFHSTMRPSFEHQKVIFMETMKRKIRLALSGEEQDIATRFDGLLNQWLLAGDPASPAGFAGAGFGGGLLPMMRTHALDLVMVINRRGELLFCRAGRDEVLPGWRPGDRSIRKLWAIALKPPPEKDPVILHSRAGPILVTTRLIYDTQIRPDVGPKSNGILVLGRFIDEKTREKISRYTMEDVNIFAGDSATAEFFSRNRMGGENIFYEEKDNRIRVYYLLRDIHDKPVMILSAIEDNRLFRVVNRRLLAFLVVTFCSIALFGLLLYMGIRKYIIRPVLHISSAMKAIEGPQDLSRRIVGGRGGADEIARLVADINTMLDRLENEKIKRETAEKTMMTQAKLASVGRLTSCIGHEVNNPLLAIGNSVEVLKKICCNYPELLKEEMFADAMEILESEIHRIREIMGSLLDFQRVERQEIEVLDVCEVMLKSLDVLKWSKKLGTARIESRLGRGCMLQGSSGKLKQVFINFILNAVEAMRPEGGESGDRCDDALLQIRVEPCGDDETVDIHFIDNGPGIPEEIKGHLFEPFVSTKGAGGVGLGLYISYRIVEQHGGRIIHREDGVGGGAHFIIKLPVAKLEPRDAGI